MPEVVTYIQQRNLYPDLGFGAVIENSVVLDLLLLTEATYGCLISGISDILAISSETTLLFRQKFAVVAM